MPRKKKVSVLSFLETLKKAGSEVDSSFQAFTGISLKQVFTGALKDAAEDAHEKASRPVENYTVLGVEPTDPPEKVKQVYLALVKVYHESGISSNPQKMRDINNAYQAICKERGWPK